MPAAILCTLCGAASAKPVANCAKRRGKNARVCSGCGFQNSLAKNYCDKCGNPISELGDAAPPPAAAPSETDPAIPVTVIKHLKKTGPAELPPTTLPSAKSSALEPGAPQEAPLVPAKKAADPFAAPQVSNDPWAAVAQPQAETKSKVPRWISALRRILTVGIAVFAVIAALAGLWYLTENNKPENASHLAAIRYLDALRSRDYAAAYSQLSDLARKSCTLDEFIASADTSTWSWSDLRVERMEPGSALLAYELTAEGAAPRTDRVLFVLENEKWVRPYNWTLMRKVEEAFDANNPEMGLVLAEAAAAINTRDPRARGYLCEAAYYRKSPADTELQCKAAIELAQAYPSNLSLKSLYHLHAILADTYKNALHMPERALDHLNRMISFPNISPADQCGILLASSEAHLALSRPGEALNAADRAGELCVRPQDHASIKEIRIKLNAPQNQ